MKKLFLIMLLISDFHFLTPAVQAQSEAEIDQKQNELEHIKKQLEDAQIERNSLLNKEKTIQGELQRIDRELNLAEKLVLDYNWILHVTNKHIKRLEAELDTISVKLDYRQQIMHDRLRSIFKSGKYTSFEILFSSDSFAELIQKYEFLKLIARQDYVIYEEIKAYQHERQAKQAELEAKMADTRVILAEKRKRERSINQRHQERERLLGSVKNDRVQHELMITELKQAATRIENFFASLEKKREGQLLPEDIPSLAQSNHYLYKNRGQIPWPVPGKVIESYGRKIHPKYHTETFNKGIDIGARKGASVKAIASGTVAFADWFSGYGKLVILDHGDGFYSLYAHLNTISVSQGGTVSQGTVIGSVGNTGSIKEPHLHFEIRYRDQTVNPVGWLK